MGFTRNPEKQSFISLRLEWEPRPGGRSAEAAKKYYGGLYHRMDVGPRRREVEEWKAGRGGDEGEGKEYGGGKGSGKKGNEGLKGEMVAKVAKGKAKGRKKVVARADSVVAESAKGDAGTTEKAEQADDAGAAAEEQAEAGEVDTAPNAVDGQDDDTIDATPRDSTPLQADEHADVPTTPSPKDNEQGDAQLKQLQADSADKDSEEVSVSEAPATVLDEAKSTTAAQQDDGAVRDAEQDSLTRLPSTALPDSKSEGEPRLPEAKQDDDGADIEDVEQYANTVPHVVDDQIAAEVDDERDGHIVQQGEATAASSGGEGEDQIVQPEEDSPAPETLDLLEHPEAEDTASSSPESAPANETAEAEGDVQPESHGSGDADSVGSIRSQSSAKEREQPCGAEQSDEEINSLFVSDDDELDASKEPEDQPDASEAPPSSVVLDAPDTINAEITHQAQFLSNLARALQYSSEEESDEDDGIPYQPTLFAEQIASDSDSDSDSNSDSEFTPDEQSSQTHGDQNLSKDTLWISSSDPYFTPDSFLPDAMLPASPPPTITNFPPKPTSNSPDTPGFDDSVPAGKKRSLDDALSSLPPTAQTAYSDTSDHQALQGRYIGDLGAPDGPKQKRPRLRRPGQVALPREEEGDGVVASPKMEGVVQKGGEVGDEKRIEGGIGGTPLTLASLLLDVETRPQYPGQRR